MEQNERKKTTGEEAKTTDEVARISGETLKNSGKVANNPEAGAKTSETKKKRRKKKRAKKAGRVLLGIFLVIVIAVAVLASPLLSDLNRKVSGEESVTVVIPKGASGAEIAEILKTNGVIKSEFAFRMKLKSSPYRDQLNYGEFELKKEMCLDEIIDAMRISTEMKEGIRITIPEGFSAEQIAARLEEEGLVTKEEFLRNLAKVSSTTNL